MSDIAATAALCKEMGALFVVDNTFLSPYFQNPLDLGADAVVHSVTKYIGGHSDVVGGVVVTSDPAVHEKLRFVQNSVGGVPSPFDCYMALRGLKTLHVRLEAAASNAMVSKQASQPASLSRFLFPPTRSLSRRSLAPPSSAHPTPPHLAHLARPTPQAIAKHLEAHPAVARVLYPGLPSHPQHALACKQQHGPGAMVTLYVKGGLSNARKFLESLKVFILAESLGAGEWGGIGMAACREHVRTASVCLSLDVSPISVAHQHE